jgi:hypothetical protein
MPNYTARMQYLQSIYTRYHRASKEDKGRILDEFCKVCKYHRKHALRLLRRPLPRGPRPQIKRRAVFTYSPVVLQAARMIWKAAGYLCGQRLKEAIPQWLPALEKRLSLSANTRQALLTISARQLDARLKPYKTALRRRFYSTTRPGRLLKSMIPIRTFNGDIKIPGYLEIDLVAHCGGSLEGHFLWTLTATDIHTGWTDRFAVLGKGQTAVFDGLQQLRQRLPFQLRGIDSDNGEEFINYHLLDFCRNARPPIAFTRSRPNKKNDNPHVEQKNFTHVRTFLGSQRWESEEARDFLNALYAHELLWFQNLFQPSTKLKTKVHIGSKIHRTYDRPTIPLQRLIATRSFHRAKLKALQRHQTSIDPFDLSDSIDQKLAYFRTLACQTPPSSGFIKRPAPKALYYFKERRRQHQQMRKAERGIYFRTFQRQQKRSLTSVTS